MSRVDWLSWTCVEGKYVRFTLCMICDCLVDDCIVLRSDFSKFAVLSVQWCVRLKPGFHYPS